MEKMANERRKNTRLYSQIASVKIILKEDAGYKPFEAELINCSKSGAQLIAEGVNIKVANQLVLKAFEGMPSGDKQIGAKVVWVVEDGNEVKFGCEFNFPVIGFPDLI
jgi:hypothetical protein